MHLSCGLYDQKGVFPRTLQRWFAVILRIKKSIGSGVKTEVGGTLLIEVGGRLLIEVGGYATSRATFGRNTFRTCSSEHVRNTLGRVGMCLGRVEDAFGRVRNNARSEHVRNTFVRNCWVAQN